jgi:exonuclease III
MQRPGRRPHLLAGKFEFKTRHCCNKLHPKRLQQKTTMFTCDICSKSFRHEHHLATHRATHEDSHGQKNWPCNKCDKSLSSKQCLTSHMKVVHDKIKEFRCTKCDKSFAANYYLQTHIDVFHNEIKFNCDKCPKCYESQSALSRHQSKYHLTQQAAKDFFSDHLLTIVTLNINTLTSERKMNLFRHFIEDIGCPLVVCLSEIWTPLQPLSLNLPGYNDPILHRREDGKDGGGLAIYVKDGVLVDQEYRSKPENALEVLAVNITTGETKLIVVTIYRPPNMNTKETWTQLNDVFRELMTDQNGTPRPCVINGDFNMDLTDQGKKRWTKYQALLDDHSLCQFIQYPTRVTETSETLIDHVLAKNGTDISTTVAGVAFSDHRATLCKLTL